MTNKAKTKQTKQTKPRYDVLTARERETVLKTHRVKINGHEAETVSRLRDASCNSNTGIRTAKSIGKSGKFLTVRFFGTDFQHVV